MARIEAHLGHLLRGDSSSVSGSAVATVPATRVAHAERRLHQLMSPDRDQEERATTSPRPAVSVQSCVERGYSVVTVQCRYRPKLLLDVVCTLTDMDYVVFHSTIDTTGDQAHQESHSTFLLCE